MYESNRICRLSCHLYILRYLYFLAYIINFSICPTRASCQRVPCSFSLYALVLYTYTLCIYCLRDDSSQKPRLIIFRCVCNSQLVFVREVVCTSQIVSHTCWSIQGGDFFERVFVCFARIFWHFLIQMQRTLGPKQKLFHNDLGEYEQDRKERKIHSSAHLPSFSLLTPCLKNKVLWSVSVYSDFCLGHLSLVLVAFMCFFLCFVFSSPQAAEGNCTSQHSYGCFLCVGFVQEARFSKQTANGKNKLEGWAFFHVMNKYKCLLLEVLQEKMEHWVVLVPGGSGGTVSQLPFQLQLLTETTNWPVN